MTGHKTWMFILVALLTSGTVWALGSAQPATDPEADPPEAQEGMSATAPLATPDPILLSPGSGCEPQVDPGDQPCECFHADDLVPCRCIGEVSFCPDACFEGFEINYCEESFGECLCTM